MRRGSRFFVVVAFVLLLAPCSSGETTLAVKLKNAIVQGDASAVRTLLAQGADPNARFTVNSKALGDNAFLDPSILDAACVLGKREIVELLIQGGAKVDPLGGGLKFAALSGNLDIVDALIAAQEPGSTSCQDNAMAYGAEAGNLPLVCAMLDKGAHADATDEGMTALRLAAEGGYTDIAAELLSHNADVSALGGDSMQGSSAIWYALNGKKWETAAFLASKGANGCGRQNALVLAINLGKDDIACAMVRNGADVNERERSSRFPLFAAAYKKNTAVAAVLLEAGANPNVGGSQGETPIMCAPAGPVELVRLLLSKGADPNIRTTNGETALTRATKIPGNVAVVKELLRGGTKPDAVVLANLIYSGSFDAEVVSLMDKTFASNPPADKPGQLFLALMKRDLEAAGRLIAGGVSANSQGANYVTPLMCFAERGDVELVKFLLAHGANTLLEDKNKRIAMDHAARSGNNDVLELLLNPSRLETALCDAAAAGNVEGMKLLLKKGARPDAKGVDGCTALRAAADGRLTLDYLARLPGSPPPVEVVKLLLDSGAKIDLTGGEFCATPLSAAGNRGDLDVIHLLLTRGADPVKAVDGALYFEEFEAARLMLEKIPKARRLKSFDWTGYSDTGSPLVPFRLLDEMGISAGLVSGSADALLFSIRTGYPEAAVFLLQHGAPLKSENADAGELLIEACDHGYRDVVKAILERKVDVRTTLGTDALRLAMHRGDLELARMLMAKGAASTLPVAELDYFVVENR